MAEAPLPERRFVEVVLLWCNSVTVPPTAALEFVLRAAAQKPAEDELVKTIKSAVERLGPDPTEDARSEALEVIKEWVVAMDYDGGTEKGRAARKRAREEVRYPKDGSSAYQEFKRRRSQIAGDIALEEIENAFSIAQERSYYQKRSAQKDLTRLNSMIGAVAVVDAGLLGKFDGKVGAIDELKRLCPHIFAHYQERGTLATFEGALSHGTAPALQPPQSHGNAPALEDAPPRELD
jgi:hypothetical protein